MIGRLNHIGIAVPSIKEALATYRDLYGATDATPIRDMPSQGVRFAFVNLPNSQLELIEPLSEGSPIAKFLEKYPSGGQHHLCFEVPDLIAARDALVQKGAVILGEPRIGAHGVPIVFVHPKNSHGVLVELMEVRSDHSS